LQRGEAFHEGILFGEVPDCGVAHGPSRHSPWTGERKGETGELPRLPV